MTMFLRTITIAATVVCLGSNCLAWQSAQKLYKHVAAFSIDGFHSSDVEKYINLRPGSVIAKLLETGHEYTNAYTSAVCSFLNARQIRFLIHCLKPSDSFPGALAQFTGAGPRTTGV